MICRMKPWFVPDTQLTERVSEEDMTVFRSVCPDRTYARGDRIFRAGDEATSLHVIAGGQVKLVSPTATGNERILAVCGPSDFIGEAFVADESHYRVDAVALTDVTTCPVTREQFLQLASDAPAFVLTFTEILASHLFHCRDQLSASYAPVRSRVAQVFLEQIGRFGKADGDGWWTLSTMLKHEDIASMVGATRVSVSMAIADLRDDGILEGTRGEYRLHRAGMVDQAEEAG